MWAALGRRAIGEAGDGWTVEITENTMARPRVHRAQLLKDIETDLRRASVLATGCSTS
jgi:hypothetical protein